MTIFANIPWSLAVHLVEELPRDWNELSTVDELAEKYLPKDRKGGVQRISDPLKKAHAFLIERLPFLTTEPVSFDCPDYVRRFSIPAGESSCAVNVWRDSADQRVKYWVEQSAIWVGDKQPAMPPSKRVTLDSLLASQESWRSSALHYALVLGQLQMTFRMDHFEPSDCDQVIKPGPSAILYKVSLYTDSGTRVDAVTRSVGNAKGTTLTIYSRKA
jgi:hypothetical protein